MSSVGHNPLVGLIAGKHGVSVAQTSDQAPCISEAVDQSTLLFSFSFICTCFIIQYKVQCILLLYSILVYIIM
jgi:hypothetical protein